MYICPLSNSSLRGWVQHPHLLSSHSESPSLELLDPGLAPPPSVAPLSFFLTFFPQPLKPELSAPFIVPCFLPWLLKVPIPCLRHPLLLSTLGCSTRDSLFVSYPTWLCLRLLVLVSTLNRSLNRTLKSGLFEQKPKPHVDRSLG